MFPAPSRVALDVDDYETACRLNKTEVGRALSQQAFSLLPKVRHVDLLLTCERSARERVREVHPALCFWVLNGCRPMRHNKRRKEGFRERMRLLTRVLPGAGEIVEEALAQHLRKDVDRDDILDALVAAVTGRHRRLTSIAFPVMYDGCGLPMEMVYPW